MRSDQRWSLTDYTSFLVMEECGITEPLAYDRDFERAGFVALFEREAGMTQTLYSSTGGDR